MMHQLALDVGLADYARFGSYFFGRNAPAVHSLQAAAAAPAGALIWLCGPGEVGKTHLLQAAVTHAADQGLRCAYLPLGAKAGLDPDMLQGMDSMDLIALDDVDAVAGSAVWEAALFALFEAARAEQASLLFSAAQAPAHCGFELADLASRFSAAAAFRLLALNDDEKLAALQLRAAWRGFDLPDEVGAYLLKRVDRSVSSLFALLDRLDRETLAAKKKVSMALARSILNAAG